MEVALRSSCKIVGIYGLLAVINEDGGIDAVVCDANQLADDLVSKYGFELHTGVLLAIDISSILASQTFSTDGWMVLGPLTIRIIWSACCIENKKSQLKTQKPTKRLSKQTLRDAIRAQQKCNMKNSGEENNGTVNSDLGVTALPKAQQKSTTRLHQGKSKTFKHKTKRRGRV